MVKLLRGLLFLSLQRYTNYSEGTRKSYCYFLTNFLQGPGTFMSFALEEQNVRRSFAACAPLQ